MAKEKRTERKKKTKLKERRKERNLGQILDDFTFFCSILILKKKKKEKMIEYFITLVFVNLNQLFYLFI